MAVSGLSPIRKEISWDDKPHSLGSVAERYLRGGLVVKVSDRGWHVISLSSVPLKTHHVGSSTISRTCAHYSAISDDKLVKLTSLVKMWTPQEKLQCILWLTEFKSVPCVQRRVRTQWNVDPSTSKSIPQWERTLQEKGTLVSQTSKYL
ncbi:uncharacterized protein TNCV_51621 [Trichonephila clavipes]|nr:uncharacterized protein TNCV_51621 [Trichonephila clavipes]